MSGKDKVTGNSVGTQCSETMVNALIANPVMRDSAARKT